MKYTNLSIFWHFQEVGPKSSMKGFHKRIYYKITRILFLSIEKESTHTHTPKKNFEQLCFGENTQPTPELVIL